MQSSQVREIIDCEVSKLNVDVKTKSVIAVKVDDEDNNSVGPPRAQVQCDNNPRSDIHNCLHPVVKEEKKKEEKKKKEKKKKGKKKPPSLEARKSKEKGSVKEGEFNIKENFNDSVNEQTLVEAKIEVVQGMCIIINYTFKSQKDLKRMDYQKDYDNISDLFTSLGFIIKILEDMPKGKLIECINRIWSNIMDISGLTNVVIVLTTHGNESYIYINKEKITRDTFLGYFDEYFKREELQKVFLLCYCQGSKEMLSGDIPARVDITEHPYYKNTLIGYATLPGYMSYSGDFGDVYLKTWGEIAKDMIKKKNALNPTRVQIKCEMELKHSELDVSEMPNVEDKRPKKQCSYHFKSQRNGIIIESKHRHEEADGHLITAAIESVHGNIIRGQSPNII